MYARCGTLPIFTSDDVQALVLGEVGEVLDVERGQRQVIDQAASSDPAIVLRAGPTTSGGVSGDLAPFPGDGVVVRQGGASVEPRLEPGDFRGSPVSKQRPTTELAQRDKRMPTWAPSSSRQGSRERILDSQGSDVGVEDDPACVQARSARLIAPRSARNSSSSPSSNTPSSARSSAERTGTEPRKSSSTEATVRRRPEYSALSAVTTSPPCSTAAYPASHVSRPGGTRLATAPEPRRGDRMSAHQATPGRTNPCG